MTRLRINRWLDFAERVGWTAIQAGAASLIITGFSWEALSIAGTAAGLSACKVIVAQRRGDDPLGDLVPGSSVVTIEQDSRTTLAGKAP